MPETYKVLGKKIGITTRENVLYTSPANTASILTNVTVTNRSSSSQTFDISVYNTTRVDNDFVPYQSSAFVGVPQLAAFGAYSTDGITWTQTTMPASTVWTDVAYGAGVFVASQNNSGTSAYSTDGITWIGNSGGPRSNAVIYGGTTFVAVGYGAGTNTTRALSSTNGIAWTVRTMPLSRQWQGLAFGNNTFVAVSMGPTTSSAYSTDGITWTTTTMPASGGWRTATYGNNTFVAVAGGSTTAASSTDGITWSLRTMPANVNWWKVVSGNNAFVAIAAFTSTASSSTDGITWSLRTMPANSGWRGLTYASGVFAAIASYSTNIATSTDGISWTLRTSPANRNWQALGSASFTISPSSPRINNLYKNATILPNKTEILEAGITLSANNSIVVKGSSDLTFSAYGVEIS